MNIKVNLEVAEQRLQDILTNALEGGSNYWYFIKEFNYPEGQTKESLGIEFAHVELPFKGGSLTFIDQEEDDGKEYTLDLEAIRKGTEVMAEKYPKHFSDFLAEDDDAITADVWLQCCLFGEAIYG
jgi:hypothetical protein